MCYRGHFPIYTLLHHTPPQLHGTAMAFKLQQGGVDEVLAEFPNMSEQAQLQDILEKRETRKCIRRNFLPFIKYLKCPIQVWRVTQDFLQESNRICLVFSRS